MPYEVFWYDDTDMVDIYVKSFKKKQNMDNQQAWLSGFYECNAVSVAIANAFKKKNAKPVEYLSEPLKLYVDPKDKKVELSDAEKLYNKFRPVVAAFNVRRSRKG